LYWLMERLEVQITPLQTWCTPVGCNYWNCSDQQLRIRLMK
jgi:hypothetical protein